MNERRKNRLIDISRSLMDKRSGRCLHCAFVLNKNKLLCYAVNSYSKIHLSHKFGNYIPAKIGDNYVSGRHAECEVLRMYINKFGNNDVSRMTLFVTRIGYKGEVMSSKPCPNCLRNIVYANNWKDVLWT